MAYKDHTMGKGKAKVTTRNKAAHDVLEKDGWGHGPFKMRTPFRCWEGYTAGGKTKPSPSGKKTPSGNIKMVPDCKPK